jgi:hypothetical protein
MKQGVDLSNDEVSAVKLIEAGASIAGSAVGAAAGLITKDPMVIVGGSMIGTAIGNVFARVGADMYRRLVGPREVVRVGAVAAYAGAAIKEQLGSGALPRDDGFFGQDAVSNRSSADEVLEGILLKARDSYEEKKLIYIGRLYASIAFTPSINSAQANHLITLSGQLTYRQLVVISIGGRQAFTHNPILRDKNFTSDESRVGLTSNVTSLMTEVFDLYQRGLIADKSTAAWLGMTSINLGNIIVEGTGMTLYAAMMLNRMPEDEWSEFLQAFPLNG